MELPRAFILYTLPSKGHHSIEIQIQLGITKDINSGLVLIGSSCITSEELDQQIDYLIKNLNSLRAEGRMILSSQDVPM